MSETFSARMLRFFNADEGAYSIVTKDENNKSQVTFVGPEQELAERHFGSALDERHGNKEIISSRGLDPALPYRLYPGGQTIGLTTSYKTNKPRELRYYLQKDVFKPTAGDYWGLFRRGGQLWICDFSHTLLSEIEAGTFDEKQRNEVLDPDEGLYQDDSNSPPSKTTLVTDKWNRNPAISYKALEAHGFKCELRPEWPTFANRKTGNAHMEAHHLIPMNLQGQIANNLDIPENICCLNPLTHRMLHHAPFQVIEKNLIELIRARDGLLDHFGLLERDVLAIYDR